MTTLPASGVLLTATAALLLLSACGGGGGGGGGGASSSGGRAADSAADAPSSAATPVPSTTAPEDLAVGTSGRVSVLTGTVEAGVEPGCLLLEASGVLHQLVGATQALAPGQRVTVQGRPDPTLLTTCQQGTPFVVSSAAPA